MLGARAWHCPVRVARAKAVSVKIPRDENGQAFILVALFLGIVMIGFLAVALDLGYIFSQKRIAQSAADAAAIAAAEEGGTGTSAQNAANSAATANGFNTSLATNPATVTLSTSPSGNYSKTATTVPSNWVEAVVSQPIHTFFMGSIDPHLQTLNISASAVAGTAASVGDCVCLESPSGMALNMSNGAYFASSCAVRVNSTSSNAIGVIGGAKLCPQAIGVAASSWSDSSNGPNVNNGGSVCSAAKVVPSVSACAPTLPAVPTVPAQSSCSADPVPGGWGVSYTVGPSSAGATICYKGLTVNGNGSTVKLNPGIYIINGGTLHFNSGGPNLGGDGVFFFLTNGANLSIDNGANVNLVAGGIGTAWSTGIYNGVLFYEDPGGSPASDTGDSQPISIQGGANSVINGAIYAPLAAINLGNGSGTTVNANIVGNTLTMNGGGTLAATPNSSALGSLTSKGGAALAQ